MKATKVDVQGSSAVDQVYVDKSRHSLVALYSKGLSIYIFSTGNKVKQYSALNELITLVAVNRVALMIVFTQ